MKLRGVKLAMQARNRHRNGEFRIEGQKEMLEEECALRARRRRKEERSEMAS